MIMGDGGVYVKDANAKFIMNMVADNEDYVNYCKSILENITSCKVYKVEKGGNRKPQLRLESKVHPIFTMLRNRIYVDKYKSIDNHALKMLDYEALSFLYMSDGCLVKDFRPQIGMKKASYNVTLNMKRLSYGDLFILKKALKDRLNLEWNINKNGKYFYLRLRAKDVSTFMERISPYILQSFSYKILNEVPSNEVVI